MTGARDYSELFKTGQYGKLYITSSYHARGRTFKIQVLPEGETAKPNGSSNSCLNSNAIEVYGVVSGNPGWTESYGWKHKGKWQEDFEIMVKVELKKKEDIDLAIKKIKEETFLSESEKVQKLLSKY